MLLAARLLILSAIVLTGCYTAKTAAVKTFRVIDTPARYVRDRIDPPEGTTTTTTTETTTAGTSDVVTPGRPVAPTQPAARATPPPRTTAESRPSATPRTRSSPARTETSPTPSQPKTASAPPATDFPTARPVPGKPGFVYSIDPKGGMVDVTGYKSGDKAKDPYTHQIFVIP